MAVQKSKKSRSKRNHRRSNNTKCKLPVLYFDKINKEYILYYHVNKNYLKNFKSNK